MKYDVILFFRWKKTIPIENNEEIYERTLYLIRLAADKSVMVVTRLKNDATKRTCFDFHDLELIVMVARAK